MRLNEIKTTVRRDQSVDDSPSLAVLNSELPMIPTLRASQNITGIASKVEGRSRFTFVPEFHCRNFGRLVVGVPLELSRRQPGTSRGGSTALLIGQNALSPPAPTSRPENEEEI